MGRGRVLPSGPHPGRDTARQGTRSRRRIREKDRILGAARRRSDARFGSPSTRRRRNCSLLCAAGGIHETLPDGRLPGTRSSPEGKPATRLSRPVAERGRDCQVESKRQHHAFRTPWLSASLIPAAGTTCNERARHSTGAAPVNTVLLDYLAAFFEFLPSCIWYQKVP